MARKKFACDFETTTDPMDCRVWAYGVKELYSKTGVMIGKDIDEFMEFVMNINADLYFHNLKFDGSFIVNWLLKKGYRHDPDGLPGTFSTLISDMGQWYMVDIVVGYKGKKKIHTVIYDSLKKLPFPIKTIAGMFNLEVQKGDIDYHKNRPVGYTPDKEEISYIENDVEILAQALEIQLDQGLKKMTAGSDAIYDYKDIITQKRFDKLYPKLPLEVDKNIRKAYRGGFTYLSDRFADKEIGDGIVFDVNSMYPGTMVNKELPIGKPLYFEGEYEYDENYPLFIQRITCQFELKKDHIPTIQIKNNPLFRATEYLKSSNHEVVELYVTNVDLKLMKEHYHLYELKYYEGFKFRSSVGMFEDYIKKWMDVKENTTGAMRTLAKLMLNSLYGKFASNPDVTGKVPYLNDDNSLGFRMGEEEFKDPVYTAMGMFITSWSRDQVIRTAQSVYDRFIYCDTDSIHLTGTDIPEELKDEIDPVKMGYWDFEQSYFRGKYIRQKTYMYEYMKDGEVKTKVVCAGMPDVVKDKVTFDNFKKGFSESGKLLPKQVDGGVVLVDTEFTLK